MLIIPKNGQIFTFFIDGKKVNLKCTCNNTNSCANCYFMNEDFKYSDYCANFACYSEENNVEDVLFDLCETEN